MAGTVTFSFIADLEKARADRDLFIAESQKPIPLTFAGGAASGAAGSPPIPPSNPPIQGGPPAGLSELSRPIPIQLDLTAARTQWNAFASEMAAAMRSATAGVGGQPTAAERAGIIQGPSGAGSAFVVPSQVLGQSVNGGQIVSNAGSLVATALTAPAAIAPVAPPRPVADVTSEDRAAEQALRNQRAILEGPAWAAAHREEFGRLPSRRDVVGRFGADTDVAQAVADDARDVHGRGRQQERRAAAEARQQAAEARRAQQEEANVEREAREVERVQQREQSEQGQIRTIRQRTELIGTSPRQRLNILQGRLAAAEPETLGHAQAEEALARETQAQQGQGGLLGAGGVFGERLTRYLAAGFIARETLRIGEAEHNEQVQNSIARNPLDYARNAQSTASVVAGIPIFGPVADIITEMATGRKAAATQAIFGAEEGQSDAAAATQRLLSSNRLRREANAIGMQADLFPLNARSPFANEESQVRARFQARQDDAQSHLEDLKAKRAGTDTSTQAGENEAERLDLEIRNFVKAMGDSLKEGGRLVDREVKDIARRRDLAGTGIGNRADEAELASTGQYGPASNLAFANRQQEILDSGDPLTRNRQVRFNAAAKMARERDIQESIDQQESESRALELELGSEPLEATHERLNRKREVELRGARTEEEWHAINRRAGDEYDTADRQWQEGLERTRFGLRARSESLDMIVNGPDVNPGVRGYRAQSRSTLRDIEGSAFDAVSSGRRDLLPDIEKMGTLQLQEQQAGFLRSFQPRILQSLEQADTSGPGSADASSVMRETAADVKELKDKIAKLEALSVIPQNFSDLLSLLRGLIKQ